MDFDKIGDTFVSSTNLGYIVVWDLKQKCILTAIQVGTAPINILRTTYMDKLILTYSVQTNNFQITKINRMPERKNLGGFASMRQHINLDTDRSLTQRQKP